MIETVRDVIPDIIPQGEVRVDAEKHVFKKYEYDDGSSEFEDTYDLRKSPAKEVEKVVGTVGGDDYTFVKGTDYSVQERQNAVGGTITSIVWDTNETVPDAGTPFFVQYTCRAVMQRYIDAHDTEFEKIDTKIGEVISSHEVDNAEGIELDEIGKLFGELGKRRDRDDPEYRQYLKSILAAFKGRGRVGDITFAVAGGVRTDPANVSLNEDFQDNEYEVIITGQWGPHDSGFVRTLAELADPSGVEFREPVRYVSEEQEILIIPDETQSGISNPSEAIVVFISPAESTQETISTVGLSTNYLSQDYLPGSTPSEVTDGLGSDTLGSGTLG